MLRLAMELCWTNFSRLWRGHSCASFKLLVRIATICVCSIVVAVQLFDCFSKLIHPPISSHTSISINETLAYPSVTICRSPGYKTHVLQKYNLGTSLRRNSVWRQFPYENATLQQFWDEATYKFSETVSLHALNYLAENVAVSERMYNLLGQCYIFDPLTETAQSGKSVGYAFTLSHRDPLNDGSTDFSSSCSAGWRVFIHAPNEQMSEDAGWSRAQLESLCLDIGQEMHVKLTADEFQMLNIEGRQVCNPNPNYSQSYCEDECFWQQLTVRHGCSTPFMPAIALPHCDNGTAMFELVRDYMGAKWNASLCNCPRPCKSVLYQSFVLNRRNMTNSMDPNLSQLYVFYSSHIVKNIREHYSYNWNSFLADLGGSLGFLLGLSVIGLIELLEKAVEKTVGYVDLKMSSKNNSRDERETRDERSSDNMEIAIITTEKMKANHN
ncbi:uncharacterized protein LOC134542044 [Bacillus rossius redtenbacheri]|uniref:uncharacterized protein LOC134542044 n=1 Tax=Bacillus rossius redtenbacheri TaxID=93214 RepID=UPI002FDDFAB8